MDLRPVLPGKNVDLSLEFGWLWPLPCQSQSPIYAMPDQIGDPPQKRIQTFRILIQQIDPNGDELLRQMMRKLPEQ